MTMPKWAPLEARGPEFHWYCARVTSTMAMGANIVRRELGLPTTRIPAADPMLQTDIVPKAADR